MMCSLSPTSTAVSDKSHLPCSCCRTPRHQKRSEASTSMCHCGNDSAPGTHHRIASKYGTAKPINNTRLSNLYSFSKGPPRLLRRPTGVRDFGSQGSPSTYRLQRVIASRCSRPCAKCLRNGPQRRRGRGGIENRRLLSVLGNRSLVFAVIPNALLFEVHHVDACGSILQWPAKQGFLAPFAKGIHGVTSELSRRCYRPATSTAP